MPDLYLEGCVVRFLAPYSPDFNPIEESFSSGEPTYVTCE